MHDTGTLAARRQPRSRAEHVAHDIRRQIASGAFRQGERLASYKELGERYAVGQGTINSAIRKLVRQGLVVTERRSGAFVAQGFSASSDPGLASEEAAGLRRPSAAADSFFRPLQQAKFDVSLYISELLPASLALWKRILERYAADSGIAVDLGTCVDGHIQELVEKRQFDLIETTPWILSAMGNGTPAAGSSLEQVGRELDDLLPLVRPWFTDARSPAGLPFMATLSYLFVNLDLLEQVGMSPAAPHGGVEMLRFAAEVDAKLVAGNLPQRAMELGSLHDALILEGACRWQDGKLVLSMQRTQRFVEALLSVDLPLSVDAAQMPERFIAGEIAMVHHCSFLTVDLRERAKFRWAMLPLIQPEGWPLPAEITTISIDSQCKSPLDALGLARFLYSDEVQLELARQFGRVPVVARAALADEVCRKHPAREAYAYMVEHSSCYWPQEMVHRLDSCTRVASLVHGIKSDARAVVDRLLGSIAIGFAGRLVIE